MYLSVGVKDGVIVYYHLIYHHRMLAYKKPVFFSFYRNTLKEDKVQMNDFTHPLDYSLKFSYSSLLKENTGRNRTELACVSLVDSV
jgi:hypothetical protein